MRVVVTSTVLLESPEQPLDQIARNFRAANEAAIGVPMRAVTGHVYTILRVVRLDVVAADFYECPFCFRISHNLNDVAQRYCGACHRFLDS